MRKLLAQVATRIALLSPELPSGLGLQRRITLYVACGSLAVIIFFGYVAHQALDASTNIIFRERLQLASLAAREVVRWVEPDPPGPGLAVRSRAELETVLRLHAYPVHSETPEFRVTVWDGAGRLVASTGQIPEAANREHLTLLREALENNREAIVMHTPGGAPDKAHVVAFVPLPGLPGDLLLEQGRDAALALPRALQRRLTLLGLLFIAASLGLAWLTTRQVVGPLTRLTEVTRGIAKGDLATPVPSEGQDEVRELAASFETMRHQLRESHAQLAKANWELERRVEERTQELMDRHEELARASQLLRQREVERSYLLEQTIQAQEEERRRLARELHDAVGQLLSALVVRISLLQGMAQTPQLREGLRELGELASQTVGAVRRLLVDLRPELLDDLGLSAAVAWHAEQTLTRHGVQVDLEMRLPEHRLPGQVEVAVFRVMQEAITNIHRHAQARQARIALDMESGELVGSVSDDGVGFDAAESEQHPGARGVGLLGMRERVSLLGGSLRIRTRPERGTTLTFRLPVQKEESE